MFTDIHVLNERIKPWLLEMGEIIESSSGYKTKEKVDFRDLVSEVDLTVEKELIKKIHTLPGKQAIIGEESSNNLMDMENEHLWVIDPIDGTNNFLKQNKDFGIMLAYFYMGKPQLSYLYDSSEDLLYSAIKDQGVFLNGKKIHLPKNVSLKDSLISINPRKMYQTDVFHYVAEKAFDIRFLGSSIANGIRVINNQFGADINSESEPWDRAPFILFAQELGLKMVQLNGEPSTLSGLESYYFGHASIFEEIFN